MCVALHALIVFGLEALAASLPKQQNRSRSPLAVRSDRRNPQRPFRLWVGQLANHISDCTGDCTGDCSGFALFRNSLL